VTDSDWRPSASIATLRARAAALGTIREFFAARGVLEVDTPILSRTTVTDVAIDSLSTRIGGATFFLQTSPEYQMKRLLAGGAPSIVRIGPVFRDDESGRIHNAEFTMIEWYRLGFDIAALMDETAALVATLLGPAEHRTMRYAELQALLGVPSIAAPRDALVRAIERAGIDGDFASWSRRALLDLIASEAISRAGRGRLFVVDYPPDQAALARIVAGADGCAVAQRFELVIDGIEIANGYQELLDADAMAERMAADRASRTEAGRFAPDADARLLDAMRAGLPACAGVALGFDRLLMLKLGARSLEDVLPFSIGRA